MLVQTKNVTSMNYGSSTSSWKPWRWVRLDLTLVMRGIHVASNQNPLTKFTPCTWSTEIKDILPWNISQMIRKTVPNSKRIVISYAMKWAIGFQFGRKSMKTEKTTWSEFPSGEKGILEQILSQKKKSKRAGLWKSQPGTRIGKLTVWVKSFKISYNKVHQVYQFHQKWLASPYDAP